MKLSEIAKIIGAKFEGADIEITSMNTLKDAKASELSFVANSKYVKDVSLSNAGAIIVDEKTMEYVPEACVALVVDNPYWEMAEISKYFAPPIEDNTLPLAIIGASTTISPKAEICNGAVIGENCMIMAHVYIGANSIIGDNTIIYPNVTV